MVGPTTYLMRADSATVARVWCRKAITKISDSDAASGAIWASTPSTGLRVAMLRAMALAPTRMGASAMSPCGAVVTLKTAMTMATAAGHSLRVPMAVSTRTHAAMVPNAMTGSGRRRLLSGTRAARTTAPAGRTATGFWAMRLPSLGRTQRLMISHVAMAAAVAGNRIHTPGVLMGARGASALRHAAN